MLFTDSVHGMQKVPSKVAAKAINYVASDKPLDEELGQDQSGIKIKSAGHKTHEWTPCTARRTLCNAFDQFLIRKV